MSDLSVERTKINGKIVSAVLVELVIIIGSFVLFSPKFDDSTGGAILLILVYPFVISICTGIVVASIAELKHRTVWKWGALAGVITLFLIVMLVTLPSFVSGFAFLIAPVVAIATSLNAMNARESNPSQ